MVGMKRLPSSADPYADIPELYDAEHDGFDDDLDFYVQSVIAIGDPVLELGCGTGRILRPILAEGYRCTGVDISDVMIRRARSRLPESDRLRLLPGRMDAVHSVPGGPFGVVIIGLNGLMHAATLSEQRATLISARKALDPRGQLLIDVLNPTVETLRSFDHSIVHEGAWDLPDGTSVDKFSARRVFPASQTISTRIWYDVRDRDGSVRRISTDLVQRYLHAAELGLLLELAGFSQWQVYGGYGLEPFSDDSDRILIAAEATSV